MKVLCIDASIGRIHGAVPSFKEGDELFVSYVSSKKGELYYRIKGHEACLKTGILTDWVSDRFIPISNIDEKKLIKERELLTEKV